MVHKKIQHEQLGLSDKERAIKGLPAWYHLGEHSNKINSNESLEDKEETRPQISYTDIPYSYWVAALSKDKKFMLLNK